MAMTSSTESGLLDEVLSGVFWETAKQVMFGFPNITSTRGTGKARERLTTYSELTTLPEVNEIQGSPEDKLIEGYPKDLIPAEFKERIPISRKLRDDLEWPMMTQIPAALGRAAMRTYETKVAQMWNDAFLGTVFKTADGLSICNTAHTTKAGATTWDNALANSLGLTGVKNTRTAFRKFTDSRNNKIDCNLTHLLVPVALEETALEIARSTDRPDSVNRTANVYLGNVDVLVWNQLLSDTVWFGLDLPVLMQNALLMSRVAPEFTSFGNPDTDVFNAKAYVRFALGMLDWRGVIGNSP
jgi:phage major head subunit gpT-like protein